MTVPSPAPVTLLLLRHAHVDDHRGDVPITPRGQEQALRAGMWLAERGDDVAAVLYGGTRRTRETATGILSGLGPSAAGAEPTDSFALRNPDLYLGGDRVTMVSSAEAFAEQTRLLRPEDVTDVTFFDEWLHHPERVGFWLTHPSPPGDDAATVARRVSSFARSLADVPAWRGRTIVAVTHSPVLRSVGLDLTGTDPGEPVHVHGYSYSVTDAVTIQDVAPATSAPSTS
jgi:broad specificity phosphatase PhoE